MHDPIFDDEILSRRERLWRLAKTEVPPLRGVLGFVMALLLQWFCGYLYLYSVCHGFPEPPVEASPPTNEATCLKAVTGELRRTRMQR
jgi:hypothetical protein